MNEPFFVNGFSQAFIHQSLDKVSSKVYSVTGRDYTGEKETPSAYWLNVGSPLNSVWQPLKLVIVVSTTIDDPTPVLWDFLREAVG